MDVHQDRDVSMLCCVMMVLHDAKLGAIGDVGIMVVDVIMIQIMT